MLLSMLGDIFKLDFSKAFHLSGQYDILSQVWLFLDSDMNL